MSHRLVLAIVLLLALVTIFSACSRGDAQGSKAGSTNQSSRAHLHQGGQGEPSSRVLATSVDRNRHLAPIRTVAGIRALTNETASLGLPVALRGVVTYWEAPGKALFVQDPSGGIYVQGNASLTLHLNAGDLVEVRGGTHPGEFASSVKNARVRLLGSAKLPDSRTAGYDLIFSGAEDSNWTDLTGTVEAVDNSHGVPLLYIRSGPERFQAVVAKTKVVPESLVDSRVHIRGVCGSKFNAARQFLGVQMYVPGPSFIELIARPPEASSQTIQSVHKLLEYSMQTAVGHRVRVRGTVTSTSPTGPTTLQNSSGSLLVWNHKERLLKPGDVVDATGFPRIGSHIPALESAELSPALGRNVIKPLRISAEQIAQKRVAFALVQLDAQLVERSNSINGPRLTLQVDGWTFQATASDNFTLKAFEPGALLRITGVSVLGADPGRNDSAAGFYIRLRSPSDVVVLRDAPWLSAGHTVKLVIGLAVAVTLGLLWIGMLRRQVKRQTAIINEKLSREEALRQEAQQATKSKSEFLANMSHEIRTPMNGVLGMVELALGSQVDAEIRDYLRVAQSSAVQLLDLINDVLDMSKIEAGRLQLESIPFSPQEVAEDLAKTVAKRAHDQGLELLVDIDASVPACVVGDPHRLRQILLNLLGNAVKFTSRGEVMLTATGTRDQSGVCQLTFSVRDTGIGIAASKLDTIFSAFSQADGSTTRKYGGTGLGLSISKQLVDLMGGEMGMESTAGSGSTFWFTVQFPTVEHIECPFGSARLDRLVGLRVLIVDDNATNRKILERIVERGGMKPSSASSVDKAIDLARSAALGHIPFSLFIVDCEMPGEDGFDFVRRLRELDLAGSAPLLMLSSLDCSQTARFREFGIRRHLVKPVSHRDLLAAVLEIFGRETRERRATGRPARPTLPPPSRLKILLAEDNLTNQAVARRLLEKAGHSVTIAETGLAALEAVQEESFDVVLMDVQMPVMDGYEAATKIRALPSHATRNIPILALTAHAMEADRKRCFEAGMNDFLTKPLNFQLLLSRLEALAPIARP